MSVTVNRKWNRERVCRVIGKECGMSCFLVQGPKGASLVESVWEKGVLSRKTSSLTGPEWKDAWCDGATALNGGRGYLEALVIVTSQEATKRRLGMPLNIWQSTGSALRDKAHAGDTQPGNSVLETQRSHWWNRASSWMRDQRWIQRRKLALRPSKTLKKKLQNHGCVPNEVK